MCQVKWIIRRVAIEVCGRRASVFGRRRRIFVVHQNAVECRRGRIGRDGYESQRELRGRVNAGSRGTSRWRSSNRYARSRVVYGDYIDARVCRICRRQRQICLRRVVDRSADSIDRSRACEMKKSGPSHATARNKTIHNRRLRNRLRTGNPDKPVGSRRRGPRSVLPFLQSKRRLSSKTICSITIGDDGGGLRRESIRANSLGDGHESRIAVESSAGGIWDGDCSRTVALILDCFRCAVGCNDGIARDRNHAPRQSCKSPLRHGCAA